MKIRDLYTDSLTLEARIENGLALADLDRDISKVVVFGRHDGKNVSRAFVRGFGIKQGAIATTVGHDAHNLCAIGVDDRDMFAAVRRVNELNGGIVSVINGQIKAEIPLPIAGLMSDKELTEVVGELEEIKKAIRVMGSRKDILMILHFIQLAVIPELKITDQGLVNVLEQRIVELFV